MSGKRSLLILICTCLLVLSGCSFSDKSKKNRTVEDRTAVFTFAGETVSKGEVYIYVNTVKERYEYRYGEDVWDKTPEQLATSTDVAEDAPTMEEVTRENIIQDIVNTKVLVSKQEDYGIELSPEWMQELKEQAEAFCDGLNDADVQSMEITVDLAYKVLYENAVAGLVKEKLLADSDIEISDETARMTTFYDMYFNCFTKDAAGNIIPFTEAEREKQYENAIQACSMLATAEVDNNAEAKSIDKLADYYELEYASDYTLTPDEILEIYGQDIYDKLYAMENGDYSTVIESEYGYHVFLMIALTDKKATAANKEIIKKQRMDTLLHDSYIKWRKELDKDFSYPDSVNMDIYNSIVIND